MNEQNIHLLEQYRKALDETAIVSKTDKHGIITFVNDKFCKISGYSEEELIGKPHNIVRHPDTPKSLFKELWKTILAKKTFKGIIKNRKKDGSYYYVDSTIIPIMNENGEIIEFIAVRYDVTELIDKRQEAIAANRAKEVFLSRISHELRTPLNAIIGFSQILENKDDIPEYAKSFLNKIKTSGKHLLALINEMIDFSKISSGNIKYTPHHFKVNGFLNDIKEKIYPIAKEKSIDLIIPNIEEDTIIGDHNLLKVAITSLLVNAIKLSPNNHNIYLSFIKKHNKGVFTIDYFGNKIDEDEARILSKQVDDIYYNNTQNPMALNLELSIAKKVIDLHNGKLSIISKDKKNSFIISIPLKDKL
ncbi:PAS domain-containing sensor histidine kinase [Hydrogenimonas thermophila]|uniref:PAS domain-containing sensor histidine kinase n=1 Tax=Hydrogenimonas thermophila TaxID=223786 RepID=UPI0029373155|nr:PAS domain-containing sensor histidine kinase [Hydrogenimonas thermophila]WOE70044.1 PAS domain-containing sensor histidine kinase [Hydrogenimonas thermophila]WOE72561.1 PAS domain-containing sensor histidine kinase [Hydrogenimonas thermophila]